MYPKKALSKKKIKSWNQFNRQIQKEKLQFLTIFNRIQTKLQGSSQDQRLTVNHYHFLTKIIEKFSLFTWNARESLILS